MKSSLFHSYTLCFILLYIAENKVKCAKTVSSNNDKSNSVYPPFTEKEKIAIKQFREQVNPYLYQDYMKLDQYLIRWIRDSNFDLESAKTKLLNSLKWRKENKIDTIIEEDFSYFLENCPFIIQGHDKVGRPFATVSVGTCNLRKLVVSSGDIKNFERYMSFILESAANEVQKILKSGKDIRDGILLVDANGFNLRSHSCLKCIPGMLSVFQLYEAHYPDYLHRLFFVNVPRAFESLLERFFPVFSPKSNAIKRVYGFDRSQWQAELLKLMNPDQLPRKYGGTKQ